MATSVRLKLNSKGIRKLLTSAEVAGDLQKRAERIAKAAGGEAQGFRASKTGGPSRARSIVITTTYAAQKRQARENVLQRALNAGK